MKIYKNSLVVVLLLSILIFSCEKEDERKEEEITKLEQYIESLETAGDTTLLPTASGMYYIETLAGTGEKAIAGKYVKLYYTGRLIDGTVFDTNVGTNKPISFVLGAGAVISGWDEGISYMKKGGKATFIIPSDIGYGSKGNGTIPPYSTLVFDVELIDVY